MTAYEYVTRAEQALSIGKLDIALAELFGPQVSEIDQCSAIELCEWAYREREQGYGLRAEALWQVAERKMAV